MVRVDIYCGFLGAGKTTVIRRMLDTAYRGRRVAVIENEIGEINLDAAELRQASVEVSEMTSGCVCCTLRGEFTQAIGLLIDQVHPEYIVIEPTGVAKLSEIAIACAGLDGVCLNRVIMIVKAHRIQTLMKVTGDFFTEQIRSSGTVYLNFADQLNAEKLSEVKISLWKLNPELEIVDTPLEQIDSGTFPESDLRGGYAAEEALQRPVKRIRRDSGRRSAAELRPVANGDAFSWSYRFQNALTDAKLQKLISLLQSAEHENVWRVKAYLKMEDGTIRKMDMVLGDSFLKELEDFDSDKLNVLILIGKNMNVSILKQELTKIDAGE